MVALVAPAALTPDGLAALQAALPCVAQMTLLTFAVVGAPIFPGTNLAGFGSASLAGQAIFSGSLRASLTLTMAVGANASSSAAAAPAGWQAAILAQVTGGSLLPSVVLRATTACIGALPINSSAYSQAFRAGASAWASSVASGTFQVGAVAPVAAPAAFVTTDQLVASPTAAPGAASAGGSGGAGGGGGGLGGSLGVVVGAVAGSLAVAAIAYAAVFSRRASRKRAAAAPPARVEWGSDNGGKATKNPVARAAFPPAAAGGGGEGGAKGASTAADSEYTQCEDKARGVTYYANNATRETAWELPAGARVVAYMSR